MRLLYYIGIYELDRRYGGPEEGGWWYNTGRLCKTIRASKNAKLNACKQGRAWMGSKGKPRYGLGSVLYQGGEYSMKVFKNRKPPRWLPSRRPRYE